jgi:hypothetical protein
MGSGDFPDMGLYLPSDQNADKSPLLETARDGAPRFYEVERTGPPAGVTQEREMIHDPAVLDILFEACYENGTDSSQPQCIQKSLSGLPS